MTARRLTPKLLLAAFLVAYGALWVRGCQLGGGEGRLMRTAKKVLAFIALFLVHLALVVGGILYASLGLYALMGGSAVVAGVGVTNAAGCLAVGFSIALLSFAVTPRFIERVLRS